MAETTKPAEFRSEHKEFMAQLAAQLNSVENARVSGAAAEDVNVGELLAKLDKMASSSLNPQILEVERPRGTIEKEKWFAIILRAIIQILADLQGQIGGSGVSAQPSAEPTSHPDRS